MADEILVEQDGGVRTLTLNRPDRLNALVASMMAKFADEVADAARDPEVGCVVVTGAGRGFCSGGDVKEQAAPRTADAARGSRVEQGFDELRRHVDASRLLYEMPKPTIAMINGPVAGAGIGIAGACDLRFASETASFQSAFERIGASGDFGSTWFWTRILGAAAAREIFLLGEKYEAREALARGVYTRLYEPSLLVASTMAVAHRLADGPRMGWRYMKANLNLAVQAGLAAALDHETLNMGLSTMAAGAIHRAARDRT